MKIISTAIPDVTIVESSIYNDHRGRFARLFCDEELSNILGHRHIVQINCSYTKQVGAVRGLHYQHPPHAEMKFVRCIKGRVWDIALDLRRESPAFLKWHAEVLSSTDLKMLVIPECCAHGFQVLEPDSELLYLHTASYSKDVEDGVRYDDPQISINWPLPVMDLSEKDRRYPFLSEKFLPKK
jgi:dTDP-4-dehydrorhamnose 3,5-epimerase